MFHSCVTGDFDEPCEFYQETERKAAKPHKCCECRQPIPRGAKYTRITGKYDGTFFSESTCRICDRIVKSLVRGGYALGTLWELIHETYCREDDSSDDDFCICP
jgi:hypothetical protein